MILRRRREDIFLFECLELGVEVGDIFLGMLWLNVWVCFSLGCVFILRGVLKCVEDGLMILFVLGYICFSYFIGSVSNL